MKRLMLFMLCLYTFGNGMAQTKAEKSNKAIIPSWKLVYENDSLGNTIYGNKADLLEYVRQGSIVRVGYSISTAKGLLEHYFPADYISVYNNELYAQARGMTSQRWDHPSLTIWLGESPFSFHYLYSTNGSIDEAGISMETNKKVFHKQGRRQLKWYVLV